MYPDDKSDRRLQALLREGDPAADGSELSTDEALNLRRSVLRRVRTARPIRWWPVTAAAAATLLAAALLLPSRISTPVSPSNGTSGPSGAPPELTEQQASDSPRQIRFATEQGTQIIWVLDPDLEL